MLELAAQLAQPFYTHDKTYGFILVAVVCGSMVLWCCFVAYRNFGPPAKRRAQKADGS